MDVFFSFISEPDTIREKMRDLCFTRWQLEDGITLHTIKGVGPEFQRQRRIIADTRATSNIYILADDDCLLPNDLNIATKMADKLQQLQKFSIISPRPINANINPWTPLGYCPVLNQHLMEHESVGSIRVCRKGHLKDWPEMTPGTRSFDLQHCKAIRDTGMRVGYALDFTHLHLGEGYTTVWK